MPAVAPIQSHFSGGEISPLLVGRVDADRYKSSMQLCKNWIPTLQGGLIRRPASIFVGGVKSNARARLIPFEFSTTQAYMLEFGNNYIRFWTSYGLVLLSGSPYEVVTPYSATEVFELKYTQSADVVYLVHPNHPPMKLSRYGATNWILSQIQFQDGPYLPIISTQSAYAATAGATSGTTSLTYGSFMTVSGAVNNGSGAIRLTTPSTATLTSGQLVAISSIVGTTEANGTWGISVVDPTHIDLIGSTFANAYVSGGQINPTIFLEQTFQPVPILGIASAGGLIKIQIADTSILTAGDGYYVSGVKGTTEANGAWAISIVDATHFTLTGSTFTNAYVSGGNVAETISLGRLIRMQATKWNWGTIVNISGPFTATVNIQGTLASTTITSVRLGAWSINTGFPSTVSFHQDRLCFNGPRGNPQRIDGSNVGDYENFAPTAPDGTVGDANAYSFNLTANDVNQMEWLSSDDKGMLAGSVSAEWVLRPSQTLQAITPTNVSAGRTTNWGSSSAPSVTVGRAVMFIQRGGRKLREMHYFFDIDSYRATDLTELAEHLPGSGCIDLAHQSLPISLVWVLRNDGILLAMTYDRDAQQLRTGWSQHALGGQSDAAGNPPIVESIAVIPSPDGTRDDVWMVVNRWVNGATVRYVEYLTKIFEDVDLQKDAKHLDCGATYDNPLTIAAVTIGATPSVNVVAHGLTTGNTVQFDNVVGLIVGGKNALNGKRTTITVVDVNHFTLDSISTAGATAYIGSGQVRKMVTTISGLTYLENETLSVMGDGADLGQITVSNSGVLTLPTPAAVVQIGYSTNSDGQLLRLEGGSRNGTSIGKTRRIHRLGFLLHRSQSLQIGKDFDNLDLIEFRTQGVDLSGYAPPLFTGIKSHTVEFDYDYDNFISFRVSGPMPCTVLSIMPQFETQDRA